MDFNELILQRQSCRKYSDKLVEREKLRLCLEAARVAPSACNSQPWHFYVVDRGERVSALAALTQGQGMNKFTSQCPAFIVVVEEEAKLMDLILTEHASQEYAAGDIGMAVMQLCLAAVDQDLSTCIIGWFDEPGVKSLLGIPAERKVRLVIAIGYAETDRIRQKSRKPLDDIVTFVEG